MSTTCARDWTPRNPLARQIVSAAEADRRRSAHLAAVARRLGLVDPEVPPLLRWLWPEEIGRVVGGHLAAEGWDVSPSVDGHGFAVGDIHDRDAFASDLFAAHARYTVDTRVLVDDDAGLHVTEEQRRIEWEYLTEALLPCLAERGYAVPEPPTFEQFLAGDHEPLTYPDLPGPELAALLRDCPWHVPTRYLLGEETCA